ncbi:hypothetical protein AYO49_02770 [Verrucomicrobiaceae bacterium SCGC AG-212-N21]|nr:hypothetical protein AYO49_02770 [Verrucomicrobiaceae bacterium SCGC AG-212-N21]
MKQPDDLDACAFLVWTAGLPMKTAARLFLMVAIANLLTNCASSGPAETHADGVEFDNHKGGRGVSVGGYAEVTVGREF